MNGLHQLIAAHKANMDAYQAMTDEEWEGDGEALGEQIDSSRDAVLKAKCVTLEDVRAKAEFMLSCISFHVWGDLDTKEVIAGFVPEARH